MNNIFSLDKLDFENLDPKRAVEITRKLLWSEAFRLNIPFNKINISTNINIADGGIDARIDNNVSIKENSNVIKTGLTCYQIKSGKTFSPWQKSEIKKELFGDNTESKRNLNIGIKNCLDNNGTYIIISTGIDLVDTQINDSRDHLYDFLKKRCKYQSPNYEIWSINNLISFIEPFYPSLCLEIKGIPDLKFQTHESWAMDSDMTKKLYIGEKEKKIIESIREEITAKNENATHIRILGEPGIGKTRLVLEVTSREDLKNQIIYINAIDFVNGQLLNEILKTDNNYNICLVIDECNDSYKFEIWNKLKNRGGRIKLITLYNDLRNINDNKYFLIESLNINEISQIIGSYGVSQEQAQKFAILCSGSPRVAHVVGENLIKNPQNLLKNPDNVDVWGKYIYNSNYDANDNKAILLNNSGDFKILLNMIQRADPLITKDKFVTIIENLRIKKILQGEYVLYITPRLLHIWLWNEFWKKRKNQFSESEIINDLNDSLLENFYNMFEYAHSSETSNMVNELLSKNGPFKDDEFLKTRIGSDFFLNLAKVNPKDSLAALIRIFGGKATNELLNFKEGRREILTVLEYTGQFKEYFEDTIKILLKFALAENEGYSNNASGIFADFFSTGIGKLATSELPPIERLKILSEIREIHEININSLIIKAVGGGLSDKSFRSVGLEGVSLLPEPQGWIPKTYEEIVETKKQYWEFLFSKFKFYSPEEKSLIYDIINSSLYNIGKENELVDLVLNTISEIINEDEFAKEKIIHMIIRTSKWIAKDSPKEISEKWKNFCNHLEEGDFNSQMNRFVKMNILEDEYDVNSKKINKLDIKLNELSMTYINQKKFLDDELNWLFTKQALNGFQFGYLLSKNDKNYSILNELITKQEHIENDNNKSFLGGYFRGVFEDNRTVWEEIILKYIDDKKALKWIPEIIWRSGLTDNILLLLNDLLTKDKIKIKDLEYFRYGGVFENITENVFLQFITTLISLKNYFAYSLCLKFCEFYYDKVKKESEPPQNIIFEILLNVTTIDKEKSEYFDQMDDYYFELLYNKFLKNNLKGSYSIALKLIESFGSDNSITKYHHSSALKVLENILKSNPIDVWNILKKHIGPPVDSKAFKIRNWLRGREIFKELEKDNKSPIQYIPIEEIWKWVDEVPESRAWHLATFVPNKLFKDDNEICYARELLLRYGKDEKVRRNLSANFFTEGWSGPGSLHYKNKKQQLLEFKKTETNENVINWVDNIVSSIDVHIKRERIEEERWDR